MKKLLASLLILTLALFSLAACSQSDKVGSVTLVLGTETPREYTADLEKLCEGNGIIPLLNYLKETEGLDYSISGTYLNSVGEIKNDYASGTYIYIYTSVERDFDVSEYKMTLNYKGTELVSTGVGATEMTLTDGAIIYIGAIVW